MASSTNGHKHLQQTQLGTSTVALLNEFGNWLQTAQFEDVGGGSKRCVDRGVRKNADALLVDLGIAAMFGSKPWGYTIWRVSGPSSARFKNSKGAACLYPIRLYSDSEPTISGSPLRVGEVTRIEEEVLVSPVLDCLFVVAL